jgi:hypothetical protein
MRRLLSGRSCFAAAVIFFVVAAKVRFAMATTIITGIACGLAMFLAAGGGEWVMGLIQTETVDAIGVTIHQIASGGRPGAQRDHHRGHDTVYRLVA